VSLADPWTLVALALLVAGVVGSLVPLVPGPALSLAGVGVYWWASGYTEPGTLLLVVLVALGVLGLAVDFLGGLLGARGGGASWRTALLAGLAGVALLLVTGPVGMLLGVGGTVFLAQFRRERDARGSLRAALVALAGVLASGLVQALFGASMLAAVLAVALT